MEGLILQAFLHVEPIGKQVAEGHYDLVGPNSEIILPQVWETMVKPDMSISMHMWPLPEEKPKKKAAHPPEQMNLQGEINHLLGIGGKPEKKGKKGKKDKGPLLAPPFPPPGPPPGLGAFLGGAVPPPPPLPPGGALPPGIIEMVGGKSGKKGHGSGGSSKGNKKSSKNFLMYLGGGPTRSGSKTRKK
jgi:hypothetical protein